MPNTSFIYTRYFTHLEKTTYWQNFPLIETMKRQLHIKGNVNFLIDNLTA